MTAPSTVHARKVATRGAFVAFSELRVPPEGRAALQRAFKDRMGAVDAHGDSDRFTMVTWWDDDASFKAYMGSTDHRSSPGRIPGGEHRARPVTFTRYDVVAR